MSKSTISAQFLVVLSIRSPISCTIWQIPPKIVQFDHCQPNFGDSFPNSNQNQPKYGPIWTHSTNFQDPTNSIAITKSKNQPKFNSSAPNWTWKFTNVDQLPMSQFNGPRLIISLINRVVMNEYNEMGKLWVTSRNKLVTRWGDTRKCLFSNNGNAVCCLWAASNTITSLASAFLLDFLFYSVLFCVTASYFIFNICKKKNKAHNQDDGVVFMDPLDRSTVPFALSENIFHGFIFHSNGLTFSSFCRFFLWGFLKIFMLVFLAGNSVPVRSNAPFRMRLTLSFFNQIWWGFRIMWAVLWNIRW